MAYYGIASNLITYLTGPLHQSTAIAAFNINVWSGVVWMLPLLTAFIADSYLGRYRTILFSSLIYLLGFGLLTLSVVLPAPVKNPTDCHIDIGTDVSCVSNSFQVILFFISLYLIAIGKAGFKPCAQAFGADQFDVRKQEEYASKSSFFNWWLFGICVGSTLSRLIFIYIQENLSWILGFGFPAVSMAIALVVFLLGTRTYTFRVKVVKENPLLRIVEVYVVAVKNWRTASSSVAPPEEDWITVPSHDDRDRAHQFRFLDKVLMNNIGIDQLEDAKGVLRLVPIWITLVMYGVVSSQTLTFFTKQGHTMDRSVRGISIQIPAASLLILLSLSVVLFIPIYDWFCVPLARSLTGKPNGITMLQRMCCGLFLSMISMLVAAVVEKARLQTALDFRLIDNPKETIPMSVWWLAPQYILVGLSEVFTIVGIQEFFYDQVPDDMKSMGSSLSLCIYGVGEFFSGFLIFAIDKATKVSGHSSWFSDNLNRAHLDSFYWLLAGLSALNLVAYIYFSKSYVYKN
ncbi:protein NRT1/ PTR FAMILY 5.10-like [Papaver somniferum]|uniref:protein NRT1/ PTR FAMILY 5.10-like n=1 Tax=Papaver somniferum TaxID=3469 RepID=UPI000E6FFB13|nr:protein NRT1/ PTR FAMILY 5.10-like [Papaver somniferum]